MAYQSVWLKRRYAGERPKGHAVTRSCVLPAQISHNTSVASNLLAHSLEYGMPDSCLTAGDGMCDDRQRDRKDWFVDGEIGVRILWHKPYNLWGLRGSGLLPQSPQVPLSNCPHVTLVYDTGWWILRAYSQHFCNIGTWMTTFSMFPVPPVCISLGNCRRETSLKLV